MKEPLHVFSAALFVLNRSGFLFLQIPKTIYNKTTTKAENEL